MKGTKQRLLHAGSEARDEVAADAKVGAKRRAPVTLDEASPGKRRHLEGSAMEVHQNGVFEGVPALALDACVQHITFKCAEVLYGRTRLDSPRSLF